MIQAVKHNTRIERNSKRTSNVYSVVNGLVNSAVGIALRVTKTIARITGEIRVSKRKAYNPGKRVARLANHLLRNILVCYTDDLKGCVMLDTRDGKLIKPTKPMIDAAALPHQWSCFIAAFGRTQFDEYMKCEQIFTPSKYYQSDLAPIFEEQHGKLIKRIPEHQLCGVGWLASPMGDELTEKQAGEIFAKLGAWS